MIPMVASLNIKCIFNSGPFGPFVGSSVYFCQVDALDVQTVDQVVDGISGTHSWSKSDSDVEVLWIIHQTCHYLPKNFESHFPNLEVLAITGSGLKVLTKDDLKVFKHLKSLYMNDNTFKTLDADLFQFSPKLKHIDMSDNQIATLPSGIFDAIEDLEQVMLDGNVCVSKNYFNAEMIAKMKNDIKAKCNAAEPQKSCETDSEILEQVAALKSLMMSQKSDQCSEKVANLEVLVSRLIDDNLSLRKLVSKIPRQVANIIKTLGVQATPTDLPKEDESDEIKVFSLYPTEPPERK